MLLLRLIRESYLFAIQAIIVNKLRTILTLLGITIGIFSIILVFTVVDSLKSKINDSIASLGSNVLYIQKWPWEFGSDYPWWKYLSRPVPKFDELEKIKERSQLGEYYSYIMSVSKTIQAGTNSLENTSVVGVSNDYDKTWSFSIAEGRFLSQTELLTGQNKVVIGSEIASTLFPSVSPIGKFIKIWGSNIEVVGIFEKTGESIFENSSDKQVVVPAKYAYNFEELVSDNVNPLIAVRPKAGISNDELRAELRGIMRSIRKIKPTAEDNFAINESNMISKGFEPIFAVVSIAGWFIGIFSLLIGGFGIANIMFVSVLERTNQIGIQKAIGAKRYFILLQFLFEAVFLSIIGGIIGLLLILIITLIVTYIVGFSISLTLGNIILGISVSFIIGVLAGIIPAISASKLDPVEAIRQGN